MERPRLAAAVVMVGEEKKKEAVLTGKISAYCYISYRNFWIGGLEPDCLLLQSAGLSGFTNPHSLDTVSFALVYGSEIRVLQDSTWRSG